MSNHKSLNDNDEELPPAGIELTEDNWSRYLQHKPRSLKMAKPTKAAQKSQMKNKQAKQAAAKKTGNNRGRKGR